LCRRCSPEASLPIRATRSHYAGGGRSALAGHRSPLTSPLISGFTLDNKEKADLIAFLEALTDPSFLTNPEIQSPFR
jgi:cytochrome c peroxidase